MIALLILPIVEVKFSAVGHVKFSAVQTLADHLASVRSASGASRTGRPRHASGSGCGRQFVHASGR